MQQDLEIKIEELEEEQRKIKLEISSLSSSFNSSQSKVNNPILNFPADVNNKKVINNLITSGILKASWEGYVYLFETPIVIDASQALSTWGTLSSGGGGFSNGQGIRM